jgi:hypothetical protein
MTAFILSLLGFGCLALSVPRHCRHVFGRELQKSIVRVLRAAGSLLLAASFVTSFERWGALFGTVTWFCMLSVSAVTITALLTYAARVRWPGRD